MSYLKLLPQITIIAVILGVLYLAYQIFKPFLFVIIIACILSIFLHPFYKSLVRQTKKPALSAFVSLLVLFLCVVLPFIFITSQVVNEARDLVHILQQNPTLFKDIQEYLTVELRSWGLPVSMTQVNLQQEAAGFLKTLVQQLGSSLVYIGSLFLNTFLVFLTIFFILIQKKTIKQYLLDTNIIPKRYFAQLQQRTVALVNGIIRGNLFIVGIQACIGIVGLWLFGIAAPVLFGILYGLFSLLPAIGVLLIWVPVAILLFFTKGLFVALLFVSFFVLSNLLVDNVISPKILGKQADMHQLLIMFAVMGGVQQFGMIGIILGPIIISLALVMIDIYKELTTNRN